MKTNSVILVLLVVVLLAARSMARSDLGDLVAAAEIIEEKIVDKLVHAKGEEPNPPECCNQCGACDRRVPEVARCQCVDLVLECHPSCKNCVMSPLRIYPPRYRCQDMDFVSYLSCGKKCSTAAASKSIVN